MSYVYRKVSGDTPPDDALLFFNQTTNEYYLLIDSLGNYLRWDNE